MKVGIVGLPQAGKTTVFNLLTHGHAETSSWGGKAEAHVGVARVPDPNLDRLGVMFQPRKVIHATIDYVDLPGLPRGELKAGLGGQTRELSALLQDVKNVDALLHVVRAFEDPNIPHPGGSVDPLRDIQLFELEMIFADLVIAEKRLERLARDLKKMRSPELESEQGILERFKPALEAERPLRDLELTGEEHKRVRGFTFLSAKPILLVLNLGDADAAKIPRVVQEFKLEGHTATRSVGITAVCGKIESEIASLSDEDARAFIEDLGLETSGLARIVRECYSLLGLISFYTIGDTEVRAWTIPRNTTAVQAAGVIHSDFEKGFIKAEVVDYKDLVALGSFQGARHKGVLRLEGKDYVVREGDVILFRFNV